MNRTCKIPKHVGGSSALLNALRSVPSAFGGSVQCGGAKGQQRPQGLGSSSSSGGGAVVMIGERGEEVCACDLSAPNVKFLKQTETQLRMRRFGISSD